MLKHLVHLMLFILALLLTACPKAPPVSERAPAGVAEPPAPVDSPSAADDRPATPPIVRGRADMPELPSLVRLQGKLIQTAVSPVGWAVWVVELLDGTQVAVLGPHAMDGWWETLVGLEVEVLANLDIAEGMGVAYVAKSDGDGADIVLTGLSEWAPPSIPPAMVISGTVEQHAYVIPADGSMLGTPYWGAFGPGATGVLVLSKEGAADGFNARMLIEKEQHLLEETPSWSLWEMHTPIFRNLDGDPYLEIVILAEWMTGVGPEGAVPFRQNLVLDWDGKTLGRMPVVEELLGLAKDAAEVDAKLLR